MKKSRLGRIGLSTALAGLSVVLPIVLPAPVLAADSLASRGCATTPYNDNLVYNPSFENDNAFTIYTTPGGVDFWTTTNSQLQVVPSPNSYSTNSWPPYDGYYEAVLMSHALTGGLTAGSQFQPRPGLVGTLAIDYPNSTPTVVGTKYVLSARVSNVAFVFPMQTSSNPQPVAIEMRLRNSTTGAESAPVQAIIPNNSNDGNDGHAWGLISGTVTANQVYDKVVLRHYQDTGYAFVDDVVVCRAPTPAPWWQNHGAQGGLALFVLGSAGMLFVWHTRHSKPRRKSKASHVAVGDFNGDGKTKAFKIAENESPRPLDRVLRPGNQLGIALAIVGVAGAALFIAGATGSIWENKPASPVTTPRVTGKLSSPAKKTTAKTTTPAPAKTCTDKETVKEGYKLFRSETYKYCIQYPTKWPVDSTDPAKVTFGTVPASEPGPGWLTVTHFKAKTVAVRDEEIMATFKEPAGPCTQSDVTLAGESGKKLDCIGAANGEHHIFYIVSEEGGNLFELSYIGGSPMENEQYGIMVNSFLCDMFANK